MLLGWVVLSGGHNENHQRISKSVLYGVRFDSQNDQLSIRLAVANRNVAPPMTLFSQREQNPDSREKDLCFEREKKNLLREKNIFEREKVFTLIAKKYIFESEKMFFESFFLLLRNHFLNLKLLFFIFIYFLSCNKDTNLTP